jgi:FPC/CPF motif-containing protein YcgG
MKGTLFAGDNAKSSEAAPESFAAEAEEAFRQFVFRPEFPCLGAKAAFHSGASIFRTYGELGSSEATSELSADLGDFTHSELRHASEYATFVAIFQRPQNLDEFFQLCRASALCDRHAREQLTRGAPVRLAGSRFQSARAIRAAARRRKMETDAGNDPHSRS